MDRFRLWKHSVVPVKRAAYLVGSRAWHFVQFFSNPRLRAERFTAWRFAAVCFQRSSFTLPNRYPDLFEQCGKQLKDCPRPRLLSFGCSTGEEVRSLKSYLPHARITGVDVNRWCIRRCLAENSSSDCDFFCSDSSDFAQLVDLDAVFCLAVFQRTENRTKADNRLATGITFAKFNEVIVQLDSKLRPGGLFVIALADYAFSEAACASHYVPLEWPGNVTRHRRPLFDRHNRRVAEEQFLPRIYVKKC